MTGHRSHSTAAESPRHPLPGEQAFRKTTVSQCIISFGSNLGERRELITEAARAIASMDWIVHHGNVRADQTCGQPLMPSDVPANSGLRTSRLFQTPPIGGPGGQDPFLNAIGVFETTAPARTILDALQELEMRLGRQRRTRWDARSMDLDVVLHGGLVGGATGLVVPHPRYTARQFVLQPACDVAAHFRDPRFGWTLAELAEHLSAGVPSLAMATGSVSMRRKLCQRLAEEHGIIICEPGNTVQDQPWVCSEIPEVFDSWTLNDRAGAARGQTPKTLSDEFPRLLVRVQTTRSQPGAVLNPGLRRRALQWPAPHLMWPGGWQFPEYRLEVLNEADDPDWAVSELASALKSMRCEVEPVTTDGYWWR